MVTMAPETAICSRCGEPLLSGSPEGLCPVCLFISATQNDGPNHDFSGQLTGVERAGSRWIGNYELLEEIGHGGMGVVFKARQQGLNRIVALKMVLAGQMAGPEAVARLLAEAELAAQLQHPNIVAIHEVGEHEGEPFFSMDYIEGQNLAYLVRDHALSAQTAATYLHKIAEAVQYAHEHGVLHRDLKPSNILIDASHQPHITDFGLARRLSENSELTLTGQALGSPSYAPPEQVMGWRHQIGPAADVYGLGAVLYHLLARRPPFVADTLGATARQVQEIEPVSVRRLNPTVPLDLDTICLKCLEKKPERRYPSAAALAEDLKRFLRSEPILARPPGVVGRVARWCWRKPVIAGLVGVLSLLALVILVGSPLAVFRINRERQGLEREAYHSSIGLAKTYIDQGNIDQAMSILTNVPPQYRQWEWGHLIFLCHKDVASLQTPSSSTFLTYEENRGFGFHPREKLLLSVDGRGQLQIWHYPTRREVFRWGDPTNRVTSACFSRKGDYLTVGFTNGFLRTWKLEIQSSSAEGHPAYAFTPALDFRAHDQEVNSLVWGREDQLLASAGQDGRVRLWDTETARLLADLNGPRPPLLGLCFDKLQNRLMGWSLKQFMAWDWRTGKVVQQNSLDAYPKALFLWPSADAQSFAIGEVDGRLLLGQSVTNAKELIVARIFHEGGGSLVSFSPDGEWLCNAGERGMARVWRAADGAEKFALPIRVTSGTFSRDGRFLATTGRDNFAVIWDLATGEELLRLYGHHGLIERIEFSPDSRLVATLDRNGTIKLWPSEPGREKLSEAPCMWAASYSPDGKRVAMSALYCGLSIRSAESGQLLARLQGPMEWITGLAFNPDGTRMVTVGSHRVVRIWEVGTWKHLATWSGHERWMGQPMFSRDGRWLFTYSMDGAIRLWDMTAGRLHRTLQTGLDHMFGAAMSADGRWVAAGDSQGAAKLWDANTGQERAVLRGHRAFIYSVAFAPDNARLVTASLDGDSRLWECPTGRQLASWTARGGEWPVTFSEDGRRLFAGTTRYDYSDHDAPRVVVRDGATGRELLSLEGAGMCARVQFHGGSQRLLTASFDGFARQFEAWPWQESAYPGDPALGLTRRLRLLADDYWDQRLAMESARPNLSSTNVPLIRYDWEPEFFPPRNARATPQQIDLGGFYTSPLMVTHFPPDSQFDADVDFRNLPRGLVQFNGITFDVRGVIQLSRFVNRGAHFRPRWEVLPEAVRVIPIGQKCRRLQVLHGGVGRTDDGTVVGQYVCHYKDGSQRALDIVYGADMRSYHYWDDDPKSETTRSQLAWTGTSPSAAGTPIGGQSGGAIELYHSTYENPQPDVEIASLDFVSQMTLTAPFLIALTVE